jgi:hypothetical protein
MNEKTTGGSILQCFGIDQPQMTSIRDMENHIVGEVDANSGNIVIKSRDCYVIIPSRRSDDITAVLCKVIHKPMPPP